MAGYGFAVIGLAHAASVIGLLLSLPFGKLFHIVQRPLSLGVAFYKQAGEAGDRARGVRCGGDSGSRLHVADLKTVLLRHHPELARTGLDNVQNAFEPWDEDYKLDPERHPLRGLTMGGLGALLKKPTFQNERLGERWLGPYLKPGTKLEDPWGNVIQYETVDRSLAEDKSGPPYKLYSMGPDGQANTEDDITLVDEDDSNADSTTVLDEIN